jgi:galactose-1-phosphate uridylyltransferase
MMPNDDFHLEFLKHTTQAALILPNGQRTQKAIEVRTNPITFRTCRIAFSRSEETERGGAQLPEPPPDAEDFDNCPFCKPQLFNRTPQLIPELASEGRIYNGESILFPNLFPYGNRSAVSLFDNRHFVEIGMASPASYFNAIVNCRTYLNRAKAQCPDLLYMAITQNHLPSAGGSLVHPHLQVHADCIAANHHRFLKMRATAYHEKTGRFLFSDYLKAEKDDGSRFIGSKGDWQWFAAFAPEGFYEIWGILPKVFSLRGLTDSHCRDLAESIILVQKLYRSLGRNGYNLGLISIEDDAQSCLEIRTVMLVRSNFSAWGRNDHTGFEVMLGDMATFTAPEETAAMASRIWHQAGLPHGCQI